MLVDRLNAGFTNAASPFDVKTDVQSFEHEKTPREIATCLQPPKETRSVNGEFVIKSGCSLKSTSKTPRETIAL